MIFISNIITVIIIFLLTSLSSSSSLYHQYHNYQHHHDIIIFIFITWYQFHLLMLSSLASSPSPSSSFLSASQSASPPPVILTTITASRRYTVGEMYQRAGGLASTLPSRPSPAPATPEQRARVSLLPTSFDWRNVSGESYVSPVRDQGGCGSCYAFASMANLEAQVRIATRNQRQDVFSPQVSGVKVGGGRRRGREGVGRGRRRGERRGKERRG